MIKTKENGKFILSKKSIYNSMITFVFNDINYNVPQEWSELNLEKTCKLFQFYYNVADQKEKIEELKGRGDKSYLTMEVDILPTSVAFSVFCILCGCEEEELEELPFSEIEKNSIGMNFATTQLKRNKDVYKKIFEFDGKKYKFKNLDMRTVKETKTMEALEYQYRDDFYNRVVNSLSVIFREVLEDGSLAPFNPQKQEELVRIISIQSASDIIGFSDFFLNTQKR